MRKTVIYIIVNIVCLILISTIPKFFNISTILTIVVFVGIYFVIRYIIEHYLDGFTDEKELERRIMHILKEDGYECKKDEGNLYFLMNGIWFRVHFWAKWNKCYRTDIIYYGSIDRDWDKISFEGKAVLDDYINRNYEHIRFLSYEKGVVCEHITSINNAKDFIEEAKIAYRYICEANDAAIDILPQIKQQYPYANQKSTIGFSTNKKDDV